MALCRALTAGCFTIDPLRAAHAGAVFIPFPARTRCSSTTELRPQRGRRGQRDASDSIASGGGGDAERTQRTLRAATPAPGAKTRSDGDNSPPPPAAAMSRAPPSVSHSSPPSSQRRRRPRTGPSSSSSADCRRTDSMQRRRRTAPSAQSAVPVSPSGSCLSLKQLHHRERDCSLCLLPGRGTATGYVETREEGGRDSDDAPRSGCAMRNERATAAGCMEQREQSRRTAHGARRATYRTPASLPAQQ